jgi:hypothetical protein
VDEVNDLLVGLSSTKRNIIKTTYWNPAGH